MKPTFQWIKGHSGLQYNEEADKLANEAAENALPPEKPQYRNPPVLLQNQRGPIGIYPGTAVKNLCQTQAQESSRQKLRQIWPEAQSNKAINLTCQVS